MSGKDKLAGDSVVARADALMQRRLAQSSKQTPPPLDLPVLTEAISEEEDGLPILTAVASNGLPEEPSREPALDPALLDALAQELTERVHNRLAAELPSLVEAALQSTLATLTRELEQGLTETTEGAIRDFLHERNKKTKR